MFVHLFLILLIVWLYRPWHFIAFGVCYSSILLFHWGETDSYISAFNTTHAHNHIHSTSTHKSSYLFIWLITNELRTSGGLNFFQSLFLHDDIYLWQKSAHETPPYHCRTSFAPQASHHLVWALRSSISTFCKCYDTSEYTHVSAPAN